MNNIIVYRWENKISHFTIAELNEEEIFLWVIEVCKSQSQE